MELRVVSAIEEIQSEHWNAVSGTDYPFLRHEFLLALERNGCVGSAHGWLPRHVVATDNGRLVGAVPMYVKHNSYGEFVFDWAWAEAYQRHGLTYYPKSVVGVPYTPAQGPRILVSPLANHTAVSDRLIDYCRAWSRDQGMSSLHWLFTRGGDTRRLEEHGFMLRLGCQFHWQNHGYRDFEDYLSNFSSRKRKKVRRERRYVREAGIDIRIVHGHEASDNELAVMHDLYRGTFDKKWGYATLNAGFFRDVARSMGAQLVFVIASLGTRIVAGSICFRSGDTLYGRHWGCHEEFHSLHFEACYYQGIDYCIRHGLRWFEPGAQGEHKVSRGFLPAATWSAHWIGDERFSQLIRRFLEQETGAMRDYMREIAATSPFKTTEAA
jgi:predicted N-acyltransferase